MLSTLTCFGSFRALYEQPPAPAGGKDLSDDIPPAGAGGYSNYLEFITIVASFSPAAVAFTLIFPGLVSGRIIARHIP